MEGRPVCSIFSKICCIQLESVKSFSFILKRNRNKCSENLTSLKSLVSFSPSSTCNCLKFHAFCIKGEGSFGNVYLVRRISDNQLYALKKVSKFEAWFSCFSYASNKRDHENGFFKLFHSPENVLPNFMILFRFKSWGLMKKTRVMP